MQRNPFTVAQWVAWLGATLVACGALTSFAYQTFQTKEEAKHIEEVRMQAHESEKSDLVRRLDRIENKIDRFIEEK